MTAGLQTEYRGELVSRIAGHGSYRSLIPHARLLIVLRDGL